MLIFSAAVLTRIDWIFLRLYRTAIDVVVMRNGIFVVLNKGCVYLVEYIANNYNNFYFNLHSLYTYVGHYYGYTVFIHNSFGKKEQKF